jgi:CBS domain-containing protein
MACYVGIGLIVGLFSVGVTKLVYAVEDHFEKLPIHWMWWPAIGAVAVGVVGYFAPLTLGVGYSNIENIVGGDILGKALVALVLFKFVSWAIALAFETTRQPLGLLPLLGGCTAAYLVSSLLMRNTIMTEKIERRGVRVIGEYAADFLEQTLVRDFASSPVVTLAARDNLSQVRAWLDSGADGTGHQGYPIVGEDGALVGVLTRRDLLAAAPGAIVRELVRRPAIVIDGRASLRDAADMMTRHRVGRLPVLKEGKLAAILTRSDLLAAHERRLDETHRAERSLLKS